MSELVLLHHNEPMTTSLAIAEGVQMDHSSVIKLVRKYVDNLQEFGTFGFEIQKSGGRHTEIAWLNEGQSIFLMTLMRNSEIVVAFKKALVHAFLDLRDSLKPSAPAFSTTNLSHGADLAVAADRTFRGFLRSARSSGLRLPQALQVANRQTIARTGMDMLAELGVVPEDAPVQHGRLEDSADRFLSAWQCGQTRYPYTVCQTGDLCAAYRAWCAEHGERALEDSDFHRRSAHFDGLKKHVVEVGGQSMRVAVPLTSEKPDGETRSNWYSRCVQFFRESLK